MKIDVEFALPIASSRGGRRMQLAASACLAVVLLGLTGVSLWSSIATNGAAAQSQGSVALANAYSSARFWVGAEESLERKYRLEPGPEIRSAHATARAAVDTAMAAVASRGTGHDRVIAADVARRNSAYAVATQQLFHAADRGDVRAEIRIDHLVVDPAFGTMQQIVYLQADRHTRSAAEAGQRLLRIESVARWVNAAAVGVGVMLIALFASLRRRYARENLEQARRNAHQASHDALTGLPNRLHFARVLEQGLDECVGSGDSVAVALLDLDRFKEVNDTLGHHVGDHLLQQIGPRIRGVLEQGDLLARLGGDEFALLITPSTTETAQQQQRETVKRVLTALRAPFMIDGVALVVEASAGLASYPRDGDTGDLLLQRADIAMYVAKTNHQDLATYDSALDDYNPRRLALLADLRQATERDELVLHYQPLVNIATSQVHGVEALVRWQHPAEGLLPPAEFIALAEGSGFIHELTRYVLTRAIRDAKKWEQDGHPLQVSINISARCLLDNDLPQIVSNTLTANDLPAHLVKLEITESAIIADPIRAQDIIARLHGLGVRLSIDDFGTGYTSLAYLRDLPIDELKIDRSFVTHMKQEHKDAVIVRTAIELAHRLGLDSVAEGIETADVLLDLGALGCTTAQGYQFSRPLPENDLLDWINAWNTNPSPSGLPNPRRPIPDATPAQNRQLLD